MDKCLCDKCVNECEKRAQIYHMRLDGTIAIVTICRDYRE